MFRIVAFFAVVFQGIHCRDEPEHLHDPPLLKYIPHLWPGGGECGDRTEPGVFYDGNDLAWRNGVLTAGECAKQCADEPQCHGWSHFAPAQRCYIKSSLTGALIEFTGTASGPKPCKTSARTSWNSIFEKSAPFELKKNSLLTTLPSLPREWMVEFEFKPTNLDHGWTSIFHMTTGADSGTIGNRIPAVFYHPRNGLTISSHKNKNAKYYQNLPSPPIGKWTKIRVSQELLDGKFRYRILIDEIEKTNVENSGAVGFENVKVFAANPWLRAQPGSIKNIEINVKGCKTIDGGKATARIRDISPVGTNCVFPFIYKGVEYNGCIPWSSGRHWCATKTDANKNYVFKHKQNWGICDATCPSVSWKKGDGKNCWGKCGRKGGLCEKFCGDKGFCCRTGFKDCPISAAKEAGKSYHACVYQIYKN